MILFKDLIYQKCKNFSQFSAIIQKFESDKIFLLITIYMAKIYCFLIDQNIGFENS